MLHDAQLLDILSDWRECAEEDVGQACPCGTERMSCEFVRIYEETRGRGNVDDWLSLNFLIEPWKITTSESEIQPSWRHCARRHWLKNNRYGHKKKLDSG